MWIARSVGGSRLAAVALSALGVLASRALATRIGGGGRPASDCYAVFDIQAAGGSGTAATCTDGYDDCDDHATACAGDRVCNFRVRVCLNDTAAAPSCTAREIRKLIVPKRLKAVAARLKIGKGSGIVAGELCSEYVTIPVKLTKKGKKAGRVKLRMTATADGTPKKDTDTATLTCNPLPAGCSTTTSTAPPPASTTTTSTLPSPCGNGTLDAGEVCDDTAAVNGCPAARPVCVPCQACKPACKTPGGTTYSKVSFKTEPGTTSCGAHGYFGHCLKTGNSFAGAPCHPETCSGGECIVFECGADADTTNGRCVAGTPPEPLAGASPAGAFGGETFNAAGDKVSNLGVGCLYLGGGANDAIPPSKNPDGSELVMRTYCDAADPNLATLFSARPGRDGLDRKSCSKGSSPTRHCGQDRSRSCSVDADCRNLQTNTNLGPCTFDPNCFFGPPLPIPGTTIATCVLNVIGNIAAPGVDVSGTLNVKTGQANVTVPLNPLVYLEPNPEFGETNPCPLCVNGTCNRGKNAGKPCVAVGLQATSHDCPPDDPGLVGQLPVTLAPLVTGVAPEKTPNAQNFFCEVNIANSTPGAFGNEGIRRYTAKGSAAGDLTDLRPRRLTLAANFCIPGTGRSDVDGPANLPGPAQTTLLGSIQLVP